MFTVDASVWINSFDQQEAGHQTSRQFLRLLAQGSISIALPTLALTEVAGAISRTRKSPQQAEEFAIALSRLPNVTFISLDMPLITLSYQLAAQHGLRGADAVYAAVAAQTGNTLISLDNEHLTRLNEIVTVLTPTEALELLKSIPTTDL